jgi:DNA-binding transcriptional regulator YbjK
MGEGRRHRASGQVRRDALLQAAAEVAAESGIGAITHRSVTERAGVPLATASYFFTSIDELAAEAMRVFTAARTAELEALAAGLAAEHRSLDEIAEALALASATERTWTLAQFEAYMQAARAPGIRPAVRDTLAAFDGFVAAVLHAAGGTDPEGTAASYVALADGLALRRLAVDQPFDAGELNRALRALFIGYLVEEHGIGAIPMVEAVLGDRRTTVEDPTCEHDES